MKIDVEYDYQKETKKVSEVRSKSIKLIKKALVSSFVLLVLAIMAGAGYIFYIDHYGKTPVVVVSQIDTAQQYRAITPLIPDPNAPVGASVELVTSPIARGADASVTIKTYPGATCSIKVMYNNVASTESGLANKVADSYGVVSWSWTLSSTVPVGSWPANVNCSHHSKSGYVQAYILVTAN